MKTKLFILGLLGIASFFVSCKPVELDQADADLKKHILICKVDYTTLGYQGYYAMNVSGKINKGDTIPFVSEFVSPGDIGRIKLFYNTKDNLLFEGGIVWSGLGKLIFPESFCAGEKLADTLPYPGQERIGFINENGAYTAVESDDQLQSIWNTVSSQKEFRHYYANSSKKVAVYLYTPTVGMTDFSVASFIVFVEQ